ncbi:hypothetical protein KAS08_02680 [Candidatus Pacearchaeota archaeon]|nr:hypothetical protein [Candidatus Pacearchaeota archaeon]
MKFKNKIKQLSGSWYFLLTVILVYALFSILNKELYLSSIGFFNQIIYKIIPIFILVFILMTLSNYFITPKVVIKHLKDKGIKKWFFVIVGGILSSGPIYMWYPLLADLKKKGLSYGLIACFLYNRAIKIPLLPLMIVYFSWQYIFVLIIVMIFVSIVQGILINKLMEVKNENSNSV